MIPNYAQGVIEGTRQAWNTMLRLCLTGAGVTDTQAQVIMQASERADALKVLRQICAEHGDNEWEDSLSLADILDKHLFRHLEDDSSEEETNSRP